MQVALDRRAARMLRAREARLEGKMDDATKQDVDASLATLKKMRKLSIIEPETAKLFVDLKFRNAHAAAKYTVTKGGGIKYNGESDMKVVLVNLERGLEKPFDPKEVKVFTPYISTPLHAYEKKVK